jgi:hypothetical protein
MKEGPVRRGAPAGDVPRGGTQDEAVAFRFWSRSCGNQNVYTRARERRLDHLMAQMAKWACIGRINSMTVPLSSERGPYHQYEKRCWEHRAPNSLLIRHF